MKVDRIAVYIRLSQADEETGRGKDESNSIVSQREIINRFLDGKEELALLPRKEFIDDGFSGTNVDRPAFQDMIGQIRDGRFNICVTKDFSRFARDYIETGDYLECIFPFLGVRYISINDGYDSDDYKGTTGGMEYALRSFVYDSYSKDLSIKVRSAKRQQARKGQRLGNHPCYGYLPDPERRGYMIVDPEASVVVRRIFDLALGGMRMPDIAILLNSEGIVCPKVYYALKHGGADGFRGDDYKWTASAVGKILRRLSYTGAAVGCRREKAGPGDGRCVVRPESDWIVVDSVNEAIVSVEEFNRVQELLPKRERVKYSVRNYPLRSRVFCGCCGKHARLMNGADPRFRCSENVRGGRTDCFGVLSPRESELEAMVLNGIREIIEVADADLVKGFDRGFAEDERRIAVLRGEHDELGRAKVVLYEDYVGGGLSKEAFLLEKRKISERLLEIEGEIKEIERRAFEMSRASGAVSVFERFAGEKVLSREMVEAFVDRIEVFPEERVEIKWKFGGM